MVRITQMIHLVNLPETRILENAGDRVPIGLLGMASNLKREGYETKVYDLNHDSRYEFIKNVEEDGNAIVGISVYTSPIYPEAIQLAKRLKPYAKMIAGGHHATSMPETLTPYFDLVIKGEADNLMDYLNDTGVKRINPPKLEYLVGPEFDQMDNYQMKQSGLRTGTIITSRGCPYSCAFCGKMSPGVRFEPVEKVRSQIDQLKDQGFEAIYFLDDVFTAKPERVKQIVDGIDVPYRVTTRANLLSDKVLDILKDTGCDWLSLGIESGDDQILRNSNKGLTVEENERAVIEADKRGIKSKGFFIIGLPGETRQTANRTIQFARYLGERGMEKADFYYLTPFPGTPIWKDPDKFGITIEDRDFTKYLQAGRGAKCVVSTEELSSQEIEDLVNEAKTF